MMTPRVAAIHDISGFGRCSLTVAMPILSAMGIQCCPLPTAYLSTHTGGFTGFTFADLTDEMPLAAAHWASLRIQFQAIYTGFLGSSRQMKIVEDFFETFRLPDTLLIIDPVMGDDGKIYTTYTPEMCEGMRRLSQQADVITPNLTEAALLLGIPYAELPSGRSGFLDIVHQLSLDGKRSVVLTGASTRPNYIGAAYFDSKTYKYDIIETRRTPKEFYGTGDVFASVLTGALLRGSEMDDAVRQAVNFVQLCVERTAAEELPMSEGVDFEPLLRHLIK